MEALILKCKPYSQFHFGQVAVDADTSLNDTSDFIHSDTLFSALVNIAVKIFPDDVNTVLSLLGYGADEPTLRFSSCFYCIEAAGQFLYFMPKPMNSQLTIEKEHKRLKKVQFISKGVWESKIAPDAWLTGNGCKIIQKAFVVTDAEYQQFNLTNESKLFNKEALPKVFIHKEDKADSFYYQTNIQIGSLKEASVHFYCLMEGWEKLSDANKSIMDIILKMLPSEGIGGERTIGCGIFSGLEKKDFTLTSSSNSFITVSLTNPNDKKEFAAFQHYDIIRRGGRRLGVADDKTPRLLKRLNMITEGSVVNSRINGCIQDISPESDATYLRSGICFSLPY
jgi:CRISPR-associated protein Csm4